MSARIDAYKELSAHVDPCLHLWKVVVEIICHTPQYSRSTTCQATSLISPSRFGSVGAAGPSCSFFLSFGALNVVQLKTLTGAYYYCILPLLAPHKPPQLQSNPLEPSRPLTLRSPDIYHARRNLQNQCRPYLHQKSSSNRQSCPSPQLHPSLAEDGARYCPQKP